MAISETNNNRRVTPTPTNNTARLTYRLSTFLHLPPALHTGNAVALASDGLFYAEAWHVQCFSCGVRHDLRQADSCFHGRECLFANGLECGNIPLDRFAPVPPHDDTRDQSM